MRGGESERDIFLVDFGKDLKVMAALVWRNDQNSDRWRHIERQIERQTD